MSLLHFGRYGDAEFPDAKFAIAAFEACEFDGRFGEHARLPNALEFPHISFFFLCVKSFYAKITRISGEGTWLSAANVRRRISFCWDAGSWISDASFLQQLHMHFHNRILKRNKALRTAHCLHIVAHGTAQTSFLSQSPNQTLCHVGDLYTWQVESTVVGHPVGNGGNYIRFNSY